MAFTRSDPSGSHYEERRESKLDAAADVEMGIPDLAETWSVQSLCFSQTQRLGQVDEAESLKRSTASVAISGISLQERNPRLGLNIHLALTRPRRVSGEPGLIYEWSNTYSPPSPLLSSFFLFASYTTP